jgi:prepilin-type processing-associated H-X9-DG protein
LGRRRGKLGPRGKLAGVPNGSQVFFAMDGRPRDNANDRCFLVFDFDANDSLLDFQVKNRGTDLGQESLDFVRHRQRINAVFLDGHAETFLMDDGGLSSIRVSNGFLD